MAWIAVHESIYGPKLRDLRKRLSCSEFEAVGCLIALWSWGLSNARKDGLLPHTDREDISISLQARATGSKLNPEEIVDAMFSAGWMDETDDGIIIHDWEIWQKYWYQFLGRKESEAKRYLLKKENAAPDKAEAPAPPAPPDPPPDPEPKVPKKPPKKLYLDFVRLTDDEYKKLVEKYGKLFTDECIQKLNNYKGANGKKYQSDYLAMKNWVIGEVHQKNPGLMEKSRASEATDNGKNPFEEYSGDS